MYVVVILLILKSREKKVHTPIHSHSQRFGSVLNLWTLLSALAARYAASSWDHEASQYKRTGQQAEDGKVESWKDWVLCVELLKALSLQPLFPKSYVR